MKFALPKMEKGTASTVVTEMVLASGNAGSERRTSLFKCIIKKKRIHSERDTSVIVNCFKDCVRYVFLVCFVSLKQGTCETRKNVLYFTSKALFVLEIIKF